MIVTTWNNGSYNSSGSGYGVRISKLNRAEFFNESWDKVVIHIGEVENTVDIHINNTFWGKCPELRSIEIGKYLIKKGLNTWEKGNPHRVLLIHKHNNEFILKVDN
ncbi:hypothetical protein [Clostridium oceanicum]|uniref:Uncharacterized protein n=1 Tax=Clostridium oceanicum TaxID=1543 RepID=A0ABN1JC15_9CLOT